MYPRSFAILAARSVFKSLCTQSAAFLFFCEADTNTARYHKNYIRAVCKNGVVTFFLRVAELRSRRMGHLMLFNSCTHRYLVIAQVGKDSLGHSGYIDPVESEVRRLVRLKPVHHLPRSSDKTQTFG